MKNLKAVLLALLICSLSLACKKVSMPPKPTQTGANTMYAKVNEQLWEKKACLTCVGGGSGLSRNYEDNGDFYITGEDPNMRTSIGLVIRNFKTIGVYDLSTINLNYAQFNKYSPKSQRFYTSNKSKGSVTITKLGLTNKIISGTFEFTAEDENNSANTVKVTDGWFDITYQ